MIATLVSALAAVGSAVGGAVGSARANNRARKRINSELEIVDDKYARVLNQDYSNLLARRAGLSELPDKLNKGLKSARSTNNIAGGSDEAGNMAAKTVVDAVAKQTKEVAMEGEQQRREDERYLDNKRADLIGQQNASDVAQANATAEAASGAVNAAVNMVGATANKDNMVNSENALDRSATSMGSGTLAKPLGTINNPYLNADGTLKGSTGITKLNR